TTPSDLKGGPPPKDRVDVASLQSSRPLRLPDAGGDQRMVGPPCKLPVACVSNTRVWAMESADDDDCIVSPLVPRMATSESIPVESGTGSPVVGSARTAEFTMKLPPATTLTSPVNTMPPPPNTIGVPT